MIILGVELDTAKPVYLDQEARARGTYVIGATGTGKTTLLQSIAYQDIAAGHGVCVLDPHGDMTDWLLARVPPEREADVILFDPSDEEHPFGLNLLACNRDDPKQVRWVVSTLMSTLRRLYEWSWGPRLEHVLGHTLWTAMAIPNSTLVEVLLLLTDEPYRKAWAKQLNEPLLETFWGEFPAHPRDRLEFVSSTVNKLTPFLLDEGMRHLVGQAENTFSLRNLMDNQKILLINLSKGDLGEHNSALLGSVLINLILMAALSRRDMKPEERRQKPFHVLVDEYQNFAGDSFAVLQSEARKYAVDLIVAHQFRDQLTIENRGSALNVGNFLCFRTTGVDGPELASQFDNTPPEPDLTWEPIRYEAVEDPGEYLRGNREVPVPGPQRLYSDVMMQKANQLTNQPPFEFEARIIVPDPQNPRRLQLAEFALSTVDPDEAESDLLERVYGTTDATRGDRIRRQSQALTRAKADVAAEIKQRTLGRASMTAQPKLKEVPDSQVVESGELDGLLLSELRSFMMIEE